jgi:hypothetical protein
MLARLILKRLLNGGTQKRTAGTGSAKSLVNLEHKGTQKRNAGNGSAKLQPTLRAQGNPKTQCR